MADFILARKSRNLLGSFVHGLLNLLLGVLSVAITVISGSPALGILLVMLSKWRVFAVRPRFWWLNLKANLVDFIVGLSVVLTAFYAGGEWLPVHVLLMIFYVLWLVFLKPMSSATGNAIQAFIAIFLGSNIAVIMGSVLDSAVPVAMVFVAGYAAARHILVQDSDAEAPAFSALICGLIAAEFAWLAHAWNIVYAFAGTGIIISQLAIILTIICFMFYYIRNSLKRYDGELKASAVALPAIFAVLVIAILVLLYSNPFFNI